MKTVSMDSQIASTLMSCARLTNNRFNLNLIRGDGKSNSLECGSLVHVILEFFHKSVLAGDDRNKAIEVGYAAGQEYIKRYEPTNKYVKDEDHKGLVNTPEESDKSSIGWKWVFKTMEQYFEFYRNDHHPIISAEEVRGEVIYKDDDLQVYWKAKFDKIIDTEIGFTSVDFKTMKQRRDTLSLNNQFMGQCVLLKARNVIIDKIGFQTSLKPEEKFQRVLISYTADRLDEWANEIIPFYARMLIAYSEADYWPPNFTHCETKYGICDFKEICEHDRNMRDEALQINFMRGKAWDVSND